MESGRPTDPLSRLSAAAEAVEGSTSAIIGSATRSEGAMPDLDGRSHARCSTTMRSIDDISP